VTDDRIVAAIKSILGGIAPEVDLDQVRPDADLRDELEIDSMDFLRFAVQLHERLGVDVPEADYPRIRTLAGCTAYLAERLAAAGRPATQEVSVSTSRPPPGRLP
jgi:acyl carrier protein